MQLRPGLITMLAAIAAMVAVAAQPAGAQVRPSIGRPVPPARDTVPRPPRAGTPGDTIRNRVEWVAEDSVARALLARPGYTFTRYQGPIVTFDALTRAIDIFIGLGDTTGVAVQRGDELIVADTAIRYNEASGVAVATGGVYIREGQSELTGLGGEYNLRERSVTIRGGRTTFETEESWLVSADVFKIQQADSTANGGQNAFARSGTLTSCTDTTHSGLPHYHFAFGELKRTAGNTMVARPAVLYIEDIPVMWLPFVFQDMREGRRSGLMTPRLGVTDFIRNSPSYRRNVENLGYYWSINDYMDADATIDWLSGTGRGADEAPGWTRYNAGWRYRWIDRFLSGGLASSYTRQGDGVKNVAVSWNHNQEFTRHRSVRADVNWMQNTTVQRQTRVNPFAVLATISSSVNLQDQIGPAKVALGGSRKQFSGRDEVEQTLPTLNITTGTLNLRPWLNWTPSFNFSERRRMDITQTSQLGALFRVENGQLVADAVRKNERTTSASFDTPVEIFGFSLRNALRFDEREVEFPQVVRVVSADTTMPDADRIFARTYQSTVSWDPSFSLPAFAQGTWNLTPSLGFANVESGPFMVRSQFSGGRWVRQTKRPTVGVSISPTFYGLFPGFGGFSRFRHAISPSLSYGFAPRAGVSDEFLLAQNRSPRNYIGALSQNALSLSVSTNLEGKGRSTAGDTSATAESAPKVRILSLNFSPLEYNISRYRKFRDDGAPNAFVRGLTTSNFLTSIRSDLLPGVDFSLDHSLFAGDVSSDTASFDPYLTRIGGSFQLNAARNPIMLFARLFGRAVPATDASTAEIVAPPGDGAEARAAAALPIAGSQGSGVQVVVPPRDRWDASFTFSMARQRPPRGDANIVEFDPELYCEGLRNSNPLAFDNCVERVKRSPTTTEAPVTSPGAGGAFYRVPPSTSIGSTVRFTLTPKWTGNWQTNYDVERGEFASHMVSLQRDLHDWRANFSFTQSPNGSFAFSFFLSLKAEPDLKFDYNRATYRQEAVRR